MKKILPPLKATQAKKELKKFADPERAKNNTWFFKTGAGQYGAGDRFIGVKVPDQRKVAGYFAKLPLGEIKKLLRSPIHEYRLCALIILTEQFKKAKSKARREIYSFYLKNIKFINNWDLVDASAPTIVGGFLLKRNKSILGKMALSNNLWLRRVSIVATFAFIKQGKLAPTLKIAKTLLKDRHDLIHKAVGWMLREVGKRNKKMLKKFLANYYRQMPRVMLRYAIEKFPNTLRKKYIEGKI